MGILSFAKMKPVTEINNQPEKKEADIEDSDIDLEEKKNMNKLIELSYYDQKMHCYEIDRDITII